MKLRQRAHRRVQQQLKDEGEDDRHHQLAGEIEGAEQQKGEDAGQQERRRCVQQRDVVIELFDCRLGWRGPVLWGKHETLCNVTHQYLSSINGRARARDAVSPAIAIGAITR
jgi:hypothetical protein